MSFQWDDKLTMVFLKAYEKQPSLWNPYDKNYYDCSVRNKALENIIKELDIPELSVVDCLQQIGFLKQKFCEEQLKVEKGFPLEKPYTSPHPWYNLISEMLYKVIRDEERKYSRMPVKSPVSEISLKNNLQICSNVLHAKSQIDNSVSMSGRRNKPSMESSVNSFPSSQNSEQRSSEAPRRKSSSKHKKKDSIFDQKSICPCANVEKTHSVNNSVDQKDKRESISAGKNQKVPKYSRTGVEKVSLTADNKKKEREEYPSLPNFVPCPHYLNSVKTSFQPEKEIFFNKQITETKTVPCPSYVNHLATKPVDLPKKFSQENVTYFDRRRKDYRNYPRPENTVEKSVCVKTFDENWREKIQAKETRKKRKEIEETVQADKESSEIAKNDNSTSPEVLEFVPKVLTKYENGVLEAYSQFKVVLPCFEQCRKSCVEEIERRTRNVQTTQTTRHRSTITARPDLQSTETQSGRSEHRTKQTETIQELKSVQTNTDSQAHQQMQNPVCYFDTCPGKSRVESSSATREPAGPETDVVKQSTKETQYVDFNKRPTRVRETEETEVGASQRISKETQSTICVSRGITARLNTEKSTEGEEILDTVCARSEQVREFRRTPENFVLLTPSQRCIPLTRVEPEPQQRYVECDAERVDSAKRMYENEISGTAKGTHVMTQVFLNCLDKLLNLNDIDKIKAVASYLSRKIEDKTDKLDENICGPCISFDRQSKNQDIEIIANSQRENHNCLPCLDEIEINNAIGTLTKTFLDVLKCALELDSKTDEPRRSINDNDTVDLTGLIKKLEKCIEKILKIDSSEHCSSKRCLNEICSKYRKEETVEKTAKETQASNDSDKIQQLEESHVKSTPGSSGHQTRGNQVSESLTKFLEPVVPEERISLEDKEVHAGTESREIGTSGSPARLADAETQSPQKLMSDSSVLAAREPMQRKTTTGTQKRDPILVRVIKYTEESTVEKLDKTVSANGIDSPAEKSVEGAKKCNCVSRNARRRQAVTEYYNKETVCDKSSRNLHRRETSKSLYSEGSVCFTNFRCDDVCKDRGFDWTRIDPPTRELYCDQHSSKDPFRARLQKRKITDNNTTFNNFTIAEPVDSLRYTECPAYKKT